MSRARRLAFLLTFGLGGLVVLLSLGFWQLDRLEWKRGLIADMEARAEGAPIQATGAETPERDEHRAARAVGRFLATPGQIRYLTSIKGVGPGYRLIAPFELENGRRILVDRGFAPEAAAPRGGAAPPPPEGRLAVTGRLRWPSEISAFTPEPNRDDQLWFARDVPSMAAALQTTPVLLVQDGPAAAPEGGEIDAARWPRPQPSVIDLPNDHLGYAVTWFCLAGIWLVMSAVLAFRTRA